MQPIRPSDLRVMIIGAHPDDPDITGGGMALDAWALDSYDLSCTSDTWFLFDAMPNRV